MSFETGVIVTFTVLFIIIFFMFLDNHMNKAFLESELNYVQEKMAKHQIYLYHKYVLEDVLRDLKSVEVEYIVEGSYKEEYTLVIVMNQSDWEKHSFGVLEEIKKHKYKVSVLDDKIEIHMNVDKIISHTLLPDVIKERRI
ncbi:hypothetical protein [Peptostreptococcus faecalis]|uniref:hypothetical protein n=1 Tax=Peptostreptococcus faecalis TaxID=2045015 RepID=UPI000C7BFDB3|nr:hypothetical protein [Peptostreptococcus faecalis]